MKFISTFLVIGLALAGSLTGCAGDQSNLLQPTGNLIVEGQSPVTMKAPENGQLTVYDITDQRTIWTGVVRKGDSLVMDPMNKQLTLNGLACNTNDLKGGHELKIMFDRTD
jgi:hypothetical protein